MAVVKNLMVRAGADFSGMRKEMQKANRDLASFKSGIAKTMKGIAGVLATIGIGAAIKDAVKSAMDVEAAMQQVQRTMGGSAQAFTDWANKSAIAFNMGRADAIKYGAVYSNLISGFEKDTSSVMRNTQDLLKASAVVASGTGRSMSDVMERIRSGMLGNTESIEDLGINVNIAMIESTKAFQKFANGNSWNQLSFQTQQQIRLFAILEQATQKYGAAVADNTNSRQQQFIAQLKNVQLSLGQAFLPIYNAILPALTRLAVALSTVMGYVSQFMQALFGKTDVAAQTTAVSAQASAVGDLGDAYAAAGKKAQKSVAGFDQVNLVGGNVDSGGSGGGASGGTTTSPIDPGAETAIDSITSKIQGLADKVKAAFVPISDYFKGLRDDFNKFYNDVKPSLKEIADAIKMIQVPAWDAFRAVVTGLADDFKSIFKNSLVIVRGDLQVLADLLNGDFKSAFQHAWQAMKDINWKAMLDSVNFLRDPIGTLTKKVGENIAKWLGLRDALQWVKEKFNLLPWQGILDGVKLISNPFGLLFSRIADGKLTIDSLKNVFTSLMDNVLKPVANYIKGGFLSNINTVFSTVSEVISNLKSSFSGLINFITGVFAGDWSKAWNGAKQVFKGVFDSLYSIVKTPLNLIIDAINKVITGLNKINIDIPSVDIPGIGKIGGGHFGIPTIPQIPKLATGTNYVPQDMLAYIHEGEAVVPKQYNPGANGGNNNADVVSVLKAILQAVKSSGGNDQAATGTTDLLRSITAGQNNLNRRAGRTLSTT